MDHQIFLAIHHLSRHNALLDKIGIFFASPFLYIFFAGILLLWLKKDWRSNVYVALASALISRGIIVEAVKRIVARPRPFEVLDIKSLLVDEGTLRSFPSGHTVIFFSFAFSFYGTKAFWPLIVLATLGSLSRIYVGVHYPTDILGSIVIAAVVVVVIRRLSKKLNLG